MSETTNKLYIDANQDKPRIIYRGTEIITTSSAGTFVTGGANVSLTEIKSDSSVLVEVYVKDNQTGCVYQTPVVTANSSNQFVFNAYYGINSELVNGVYTQTLSLSISKRGGATSDTYTCYYVVYSTRTSEDNIFLI